MGEDELCPETPGPCRTWHQPREIEPIMLCAKMIKGERYGFKCQEQMMWLIKASLANMWTVANWAHGDKILPCAPTSRKVGRR